MKPAALLAAAALLVPPHAAAGICPANTSDAAALLMTLTPAQGTNFARGGPRVFGRVPVSTQVFYAGDRVRQMRIAIPAAPTYDNAAGLAAAQKTGLAACDTDGICIWGPSSPAAEGQLDSITVRGDREGKLAIIVCDYVVN